jgi:hypothetical protein
MSFEEAGILATEPCTCLDGETQSTACCDNNFLPKSLGELFDEIPAEDVVRAVISKIAPYMRRVMTEPENHAFKRYNDQAKVEKWD